jgi:hypothetical protein
VSRLRCFLAQYFIMISMCADSIHDFFLCSNNGVDVEQWLRLGPSLAACPRLAEIADFRWSPLVLAEAVSSLDLGKCELGDGGAVALAALLQRKSATLKSLRLQ